jgi:hypothetical protein
MTKDQQEERELFIEQVAKEVFSLMHDRKLLPMEIYTVALAIAESMADEFLQDITEG